MKPLLFYPSDNVCETKTKCCLKGKIEKKSAHPGNRTLVSTVGGYYDTTTPDALLPIVDVNIILLEAKLVL